MSQSNRLLSFLEGVDVAAQAAAFYLNAPPLDIRHAASLPPDGHVCLPRTRKDARIVPSLRRPNVLASEWVLCWTTPHSDVFQSSLDSQLPPLAILKLFQVMLFSLDENTRSNYGAGLLRFTQYCDFHHIPEHSRMPASEILLSSFAASAAGSVSESALNNWLAGLQYWHVVNGATWHGSDMLHHVRRGFSKLIPPSAKRAKCPPVLIRALTTLKLGLNLSNAFDAAVWAIASVAFWSCCRQVSHRSLVFLAHFFSSSGLASLSSLVRISSIHQNMSLATFFRFTSHLFLMVRSTPPFTSHGQRPPLNWALISPSQLATTLLALSQPSDTIYPPMH